MAAAEARLAQSVLFSNTVLANITVTGSITISGVGRNLLEWDSLVIKMPSSNLPEISIGILQT